MIKFGWRYSLLYPSLFVLFILLRRITKIILENCFTKYKFSFLSILIIFIFEIIIGSICLCYQKRKNGPVASAGFLGISLMENVSIFNRPDSNLKIILLIFFASYFQFVGATCRRSIKNEVNDKDIYDEFHAKYRSCEIIIASLLCYFTLHNKIYRHHSFSLIIISICIIIVLLSTILSEIIGYSNKSNNSKQSDTFDLILNIGITLISSLCRAFLDTIEKYLFSTDFIDIFKLVIVEGVMDLLLSSCLYFFHKPQKELIILFSSKENEIYLVFGLLLLYGIFSGLKNIYRRYTVKEFTPMTRALAESILDPFLIILGFIQNEKKDKELPIFIINLICSLIMVFCSCVYNEIFVLFCCGLEYKTHLGIVKKTNSFELSCDSDAISNEDDNSAL